VRKCEGCVLEGDDGACFAEKASDCPRNYLNETDFEEDELAEEEEEALDADLDAEEEDDDE
jgi:hypothetical protein